MKIPPAKILRSLSIPFDWKEVCMLCGKYLRHPERMKIRRVQQIPIHSSVLESCQERGD